jgi:hypothetical protein
MNWIKNPELPIALWAGKDRINDQILDSVTTIIRSGGCSWNRCKMCQYRHERFTGIETDELIRLMQAQLISLEEEIDRSDPDVVKVYTSGSFFDPCEVPPVIQDKIISLANGRIFVTESRCDYISEEAIGDKVDKLREGSRNGTLYVAIGLETSSDEIREKCIDKGLNFSDYLATSDIIHKAGGKVKTYLLFKPPYLTESESITDMIDSIHDIGPYTDLISMNPCTVQRNTYLEKLWKQQAYRPPYLWSVVSVLSKLQDHVTCDPISGGQSRGPHNCGRCDKTILDAIRDYNLNADKDLLKSVLAMDCDCKKEWEYILEQEMPFCMPLTQ